MTASYRNIVTAQGSLKFGLRAEDPALQIPLLWLNMVTKLPRRSNLQHATMKIWQIRANANSISHFLQPHFLHWIWWTFRTIYHLNLSSRSWSITSASHFITGFPICINRDCRQACGVERETQTLTLFCMPWSSQLSDT